MSKNNIHQNVRRDATAKAEADQAKLEEVEDNRTPEEIEQAELEASEDEANGEIGES